jgi:cation diffusion facilitator family transporter
VSHHTAQRRSPHDEAEHRRAANRAVGFSALGLALAGGVELVLALLGGSVGLLGDALHNLSDVSTSAVVFLGFAVSKKEPTAAYPNGYERAEDIAGLGVALVIWASAVFAAVESYRKLVGHRATSYVGAGMVGAVVGIVGNQAVARYKRRVGERIQSATLQADARHSWLDAVSSVGALVGLGAVALGYRIGDPLAGFAVTLFIVHVGYEVTHELVHHLMDGVEPEVLEEAKRAAESVGGVLEATPSGRWTGRTLRIDVAARFDPSSTVGDAARLGEAVEAAVFHAVEEARVVRVIPTAA